VNIVRQDAPATSGTPKIVQMRDGVAIATFSAFGGDAARSKPNSENGTDTSVGPFRRSPYTQWKSGDVFLVYPAVYSGPDMQIYIGPNIVNDDDFRAGRASVPSNITIRGVTVDGKVVEDFNGKFAWVVDPEGNKIELWEPKAGY